MPTRRTSIQARILAVTVVATVGALTLGGAVSASAATGPLSTTPATGTPALALTKATQQVRQLVQCGKRMYAVGSFTTITQSGKTYTRHNVFSFRATAPYTLTTWHPKVNGAVNSIAVLPGHCSTAYLGGSFTKVNIRHVSNITAVSTTTGKTRKRFKARANLPVETLLVWKHHLLTGGLFTMLNGKTNHKYFASLRLTTGHDDGYLSMRISGSYKFRTNFGTPSAENRSRIYNQQLSPTKKRLLVEGDFTRIGGKLRRQIAILNLGKKHATTSKWYATQFNKNCGADHPFYAFAAAWSATGSRVFVATGGGLPAGTANSKKGTGPLDGMCDSASAFSSRAHRVRALWVNYTGCDSLYSAAADAKMAYFGGHERWANNPGQCNNNNNGTATPAQGMVGLAAATGKVVFNPSRSRGLGADDMLVTKAGLWIASDTFDGADQCGHVTGHAGVCFFKYTP
jgi:hypothetical protein